MSCQKVSGDYHWKSLVVSKKNILWMVAKVNFGVTAAIEDIEILNKQKVSEEKNWCWIGKLTMLHSNISIVLSNLKIVFLIVNPN